MRGQNYIAIKTQPDISKNYDSIEFNLATGQTNYDVKANETSSFKAIKTYTTIVIRSNKELTVKLNANTNSDITVDRGRPMTLDGLFEITNIFITNGSGATAAIKILGIKRGE